jgi:maltokinase
VVGEAAVVKWCLHLPPRGSTTPSPAARRLAALAAAGFDGAPALWGLLRVDDADEAPLLLAIVTGYLPGAVDGWDWATDDVRRFAAGALSRADAVAPADELGSLTARMHVAFAQSGRLDATTDDAQRWAAASAADLAAAVTAMDGAVGSRLAASAPRVAAELAPLADFAGTPLIDVHGDLHVGQALRHSTPPSYVITDFDGNPVASTDERGRRQPAAVDLAGMLHSFEHVGRVVLRRTPDVDAERVLEWVDDAQDRYLSSYRQTLFEAGASDLLDERLIRPHQYWQECREFLYAAKHLPHWHYVPDQSLAALIGAGT